MAGSRLDRVGEDRIRTDWVRGLWHDDAARLLRVGPESRLPIDGRGGLVYEPTGGEFDEVRHFLVGLVDGAAVFTTDAPTLDEPTAIGRFAVNHLDDTERDVAITALALVNWHRVAPHCGVCGGLTIVRQAGHVRYCPACDRDRFPRTDPAIITAILDDADRLLLAHNTAWDVPRMSLVAGFVDAGESLEACVRREALEEVGVRLAEVRYVASQPWPFPRSLMLGFVARAEASDVTVDGIEIDRAVFVTRDEYDAMLADGRLAMPTSVSIAASLIGLWRRGELSV